MFSVVFLLVSSAAVAAAGDFDWIKDFNIRAEADPSGFSASLATRFHIGDAQVTAVLSNVERPADAYMVLRLGEMSAKPTEYVIGKYKSGKGKILILNFFPEQIDAFIKRANPGIFDP